MGFSEEKIKDVLNRGVEELIDRQNLKKDLESGRKLRVKFGIDPTAPHIHLGQASILWKLKDFQDLGHQIVLIMGDFTAQIGDPTNRSAVRRSLTEQEVKENMKDYKKQVGKILNMKKTEVVRNSSYLSKMSFAELIHLSHYFTVGQMMERDMFQKRKQEKKPIWLHEFLYPLSQAYDSVQIKADLELGGSDQLFNMLAGRSLQPRFGQKGQDVMALKILTGTDGKKKMSQSFGNYIGIEEKPSEQYGKVMSIPDRSIKEYLELCTRLTFKKDFPPRQAKAELAREIVSLYHGRKAALEAEKEFNRVFKDKRMPTQVPEAEIKEESMNILKIMVKTGLSGSNSEAKRLVIQGAVKVDGRVEKDWKKEIKIKKGMIIRVGKRKFVKLR